MKTTLLFLGLMLTGCSTLQVNWTNGYEPVPFNGADRTGMDSDTIPDPIGSTTGYLAGSPWMIPGGWLIPTTRGRLVVLDTSDLSFGSELRLPGSMDHPGLMDGPVWWGAGAKNGTGWVASVDLRTGRITGKAELPVPVSPACQDTKMIVLFSDDQRLTAIDKQTLKTLWRTWISPPDRWVWAGLPDSTALTAITRLGKVCRINRETGRSVLTTQLPDTIEQVLWQSGDTLVYSGPGNRIGIVVGSAKPVKSPGHAALPSGRLIRSGSYLTGINPSGAIIRLNLHTWELTRIAGTDPSVEPVTVTTTGLILSGTGPFLIVTDDQKPGSRHKVQLPGRPVSPVIPAGRYRVVQLSSQEWIVLKEAP
ncbi:MAG: PQQ-binding-like beta-propeller repeat protein [Bacteroidetes bacterium]|nr:PQQ-binding-like beta-propeller repeat protein [Bacteroidota bacterium]